MLQTNSSTCWRNSDTRKTVWPIGFYCCCFNVCRTNIIYIGCVWLIVFLLINSTITFRETLIYSSWLTSPTKFQYQRNNNDFYGTIVRCNYWKCTRKIHEGLWSCKCRSCFLLLRTGFRIHIDCYGLNWWFNRRHTIFQPGSLKTRFNLYLFNLFIVESEKNVWLCIFIFTDWLFRYTGCFNASSYSRSVCCCDCNDLQKSCDNRYIVYIL